MSNGVVLMNFGMKHAAHLCSCVYSLRKHFSGDIAILHDRGNTDEMKKFVDQDELKRTQLLRFEPYTRAELGNGAGYVNKTKLIDFMPFSRAIFFDCDTLVVSSFDKLFPSGNEIRLTRFSDWVTTGKKVRKRIEAWRPMLKERALLQMEYSYPAINTGVIGLSKLSKKLSAEWQSVCRQNISFMCDELAMQLIFLQHPHVVFPDYYNCSPIYSTNRADFDEREVRIWHGHGFKSIRSAKGLSLWLPILLEMWIDNTYGVREAFSANRYFRRLKKDPVKFVKEYAKEKADKIIDENRMNESSFRC